MAHAQHQFWDRVAADYSRRPIADQDSYTRKLRATQALMHSRMEVLEVGCGTGSTALEHAPHVAHITATDISGEMIRIANERARAAGIENVRFHQAGVEGFDAGADRYDMVLALNLLHLLHDRASAIDDIWRMLKPGGYFVSATACLADRLWMLRPLIAVMRWFGKAPEVTFLRAMSLLEEVSAADFDYVEHWTHGRANSLFLIVQKPDRG